METNAWSQLRYHPVQNTLWRTKHRFCNVVAGRGSGKTELARRRVIYMLGLRKPWPDPVYFYALPTVQQAKRIAWEALIKLIPRNWIQGEPNQSSMCITTVFGSKLYVLGMDRPHRAEGLQYDGGVVDEASDQRPGLFGRTLLPALSHRNGWCWRIGVPKRFGIGAAEFRAAFELGRSQSDPDIRSYTWSSGDILTPDQLRFARQTLDPRDYNEQYNASWEDVAGGIFYSYGPANLSDRVCFDPSRPVVVGADFNVNPMSWVIGHFIEKGDELAGTPTDTRRLIIFDELFIRNTNTQETLNILFETYGRFARNGFEFYGDASAKARKTSASTTDYIQIKNDKRFNSKVFFPDANPSIVDRFAACNALLLNAEGQIRCLIHPRCKRLITDLETRAWKEGSREPDDYGDIGHITDAYGYIVHRRFPLSIQVGDESPTVIT